MLRRFLPLVPLLALSVPSYGGCNLFNLFGDSGGDGDPCDADPAGCGEGEPFELDPSCTLEGELVLELGQGEHEYRALADGQLPEIHYGAQGGSHMWAGVRVANHARDYPQLEIHIEALWANGACEPECDWQVSADRMVVVGESDLEYTADGGAQVAGITVFAGEETMAVRATVRDPCGRQGMLLHEG